MKFFFDNNISPYLAKAIHELSQPHGTTVLHLRDRYDAATADNTWIEQLGKEGGWSIVSHDRFSKNNLEKEALRQSALVAFVLSKGWANQKEWDKAWQLVRWWPRIMAQAALIEGGAVFEVPVRFSGKGKFRQILL